MPKNDLKLFGCPICGFRVSRDEKACPRCGTKYDSETKFECPFCGDHVPQVAKSCPSCHVVFKEFHRQAKKTVSEQSIDQLLIEIIELEAHQVNQEDKKYSCPRCSWMLDGSEDRCPKCGAGFVDEVSYQCPICAATVPEDSDKCSECGTSFAEDEEPAPEAAPEPVPEKPEPVDAAAPEDVLGAPRPMVPETVEETPPVETAPVEQPAATEEERPVEPTPVPEAIPEPEPEPAPAVEETRAAETTPEPLPVVETPAEQAEPETVAPPEERPKAPVQRKLKTRKLKANG